MTDILVFSGKPRAGKDTLARFLLANKDALFGPDKVVKAYSLAGPAKQFLVDCLGLRPERVWGTDEEKAGLTEIRWEGLPHYQALLKEAEEKAWAEVRDIPGEVWGKADWDEAYNRLRPPQGPMTGRQVMEQFIEGVMRRMWPPSVRTACLNQIRREAPGLAVVTDLRRQEEFRALADAHARFVRLTRTTPAGRANTHVSNVDLDPENFDWQNFDAVIDNDHMDIPATCQALLWHLRLWGWLSPGWSAAPLVYPEG